MDPALSIETSIVGPCNLIKVIGEVDASTANLLAEAVAAAIATGPAEIELDCSAMSFIDSSGIRVLIDAWRRLRDQATMSIYVTNLQRGPRRTLEVCGVSNLLTR